MSLELINAAAGLLTVTIVAVTALAALIQLRHLRTGNQINAVLSIGEKFNSREFTDALASVNHGLDAALADPEFRAYEIAVSRRLPPPKVDSRYGDLHHACVLVGNTFELLGLLVKNRIIEKEIFIDQYCGIVLGAWKLLANRTALDRDVGDPSTLEYFEYLAVLSEDRLASHPTSYPKGVRRYALHNPWPQ
jgi:hypothetical protein